MKYLALIVLSTLLLAGCSSPTSTASTSNVSPNATIGTRSDGVMTQNGEPVIVKMPDGSTAVVTTD